MLRIPNPVSDPTIFLRVFRDIYRVLKNNQNFGLDDISVAMITTNNVTSQGAIGEEALRRSTRADRSRDPIYNQSKMYAELFRWLGWIHSTTSKLTFSFTLLGQHIGTARDAAPLMRECLLGMVSPNEVLNSKSTQKLRVIGGILLVMDALGEITRDEMMAGPMSIDDDTNAEASNEMINMLLSFRKIPKKLDHFLDDIATSSKITRNPTMTNYTRFPIGVIRGSGWSTTQHGSALVITDEGRAIAERLRNAIDVRLDDFNSLPDAAKPALIRLSFYEMLEHGGFDIKPVKGVINEAERVLSRTGIKLSSGITFSPFQQLSHGTIANFAPDLIYHPDTSESTSVNTDFATEGRLTTPESGVIKILQITLTESDALIDVDTDDVVSEIQSLIENFKSEDMAIEEFSKKYSSSNRDIFYPLVVKLLRIIGFDCHLSRGGQNYARADAIIVDPTDSIPIEIKSPGEELEISVKGVRQALENKVIFLARQMYPTTPSCTSLLVGFNLPNERSEVNQLTEDIYNAFSINIGVIDLRVLLRIAINTIVTGKLHDLSEIRTLKGIVHV